MASSSVAYGIKSWYCQWCKEHWPFDESYKQCPQCRETCNASSEESMPTAAAEKQKAHADFGWWLFDENRI